MNQPLDPFANDAQHVEIDGLAIDNGRDEMVISGTLSITRSKTGLEAATRLKADIDRIVAALSSQQLPDRLDPHDAPTGTTTRNPFAPDNGAGF